MAIADAALSSEYLVSRARVSRVEPTHRPSQEDAHINAMILRSVKEQDAFLDGVDPRRFSTSSTPSTLTELSSSSEGPSKKKRWEPLTRTLTTITNVTRRVFGGTTRSVDAEDQGSTSASQPCTVAVDRPSQVRKKPRRRQKKVKSRAPPPNVLHGHQHRRMKMFKAKKAGEKSKRARMLAGRTTHAFERAIIVPYELEEFKTTGELGFEPRVYTLEEVTALDVQTVPWDGR
jgi:hypothetical protein